MTAGPAVAREELHGNFGMILRAVAKGVKAETFCAQPAIVTSYNAEAQTCECVPTIMGRLFNLDGTYKNVELPTLVDVPVVFPSGGGFTLTFPIAVGDEVLVVFADRCIDSWYQSGTYGIQNELRMHDLSDGFALPGPKSYPKRLSGASTTSAQLRSDDGATYIELAPGGVVNVHCVNANVQATDMITETAPNIVLNGNVTINGSLEVTGAVTASDFITTLLTSLNAHVHLSRTDGTALTGPPIAGT